MKDLYTENYKTLMKETKKTQIESHPIYVQGEKLVLFKNP